MKARISKKTPLINEATPLLVINQAPQQKLMEEEAEPQPEDPASNLFNVLLLSSLNISKWLSFHDLVSMRIVSTNSKQAFDRVPLPLDEDKLIEQGLPTDDNVRVTFASMFAAPREGAPYFTDTIQTRAALKETLKSINSKRLMVDDIECCLNVSFFTCIGSCIGSFGLACIPAIFNGACITAASCFGAAGLHFIPRGINSCYKGRKVDRVIDAAKTSYKLAHAQDTARFFKDGIREEAVYLKGLIARF